MEDLQLQLGKREEELTQAFMRIDEEAASMFPTFVILFIIYLFLRFFDRKKNTQHFILNIMCLTFSKTIKMNYLIYHLFHYINE